MRSPGRREPLEIIEGFYLGHVIEAFHRLGLFERLVEQRSAAELARECEYDEELLTALLEALYQRTLLLGRTRSGQYWLKKKYRNYYFLGFQIDKFLRAYGPAFGRLEQSLCADTLGRGFVNRKVEAEAYNTISSPPNPVVLEIAKARGLGSMLDLGCGPATVLTELGAASSTFIGWGVDESANMCRVARARIARLGMSDRIRIIHADARSLASHLPTKDRRGIECLQSKGLFNELFRNGDEGAVAYLKVLKRLFPGRLLFIVDYYGKLTRVRETRGEHLHTLLHDLIQMITAQGVPPSDLSGWVKVYRAAGCSIEHAYEGSSQGIEWFVHLVRL